MMVKPLNHVNSLFQDGIIDVHTCISADGINNKTGFTTRKDDQYFKKVQKLSGKELFHCIGHVGRTNPWFYEDNETEQELSFKGDSNWLGNTCLLGLDSADDESIDELIRSRSEKDKLKENLKRSEYDAEEDCYEQNKEQEINLPVRSTLFPHKYNPSIICEDNPKDYVEKQKDGKESPDKSTNIKGSMFTKEWLTVWQTIPTQILYNLKGFCDQLKEKSNGFHEWSSNLLKSFSDLLGLTFRKGRHINKSLCQDEKRAETPSTQETKKNPTQSFNKTGWRTGILVLILLIFCAGSLSATATGLDVRPITKVALEERIVLQCKKANDGGTKWIGGPKNELLTFGKTIEQNYFSLIDTNENYNLVIKNATWELINSSYTCHVGFIQDSTKRLSEYGYEVIPKLESLTVMQSKKSECLNETIEFKKVNPLPNCTTSLDGEVTYSHKQWYGYYYAVTVGLVVKNCDGCNGTMHCYVGNEVLNITFEQDRQAETSPLSKDKESDSQTGLIVGLVVMAAVAVVGAIIGILYKRGFWKVFIEVSQQEEEKEINRKEMV